MGFMGFMGVHGVRFISSVFSCVGHKSDSSLSLERGESLRFARRPPVRRAFRIILCCADDRFRCFPCRTGALFARKAVNPLWHPAWTADPAAKSLPNAQKVANCDIVEQLAKTLPLVSPDERIVAFLSASDRTLRPCKTAPFSLSSVTIRDFLCKTACAAAVRHSPQCATHRRHIAKGFAIAIA